MKVWCSLLPSLSEAPPVVDVAVVIDVLRATSVMVTALASGAHDVVTCVDVSEAFRLARGFATKPLLCGERECRPIEGFDLGNSPAEYTTDVVTGRSLMMTTTNGTRAIAAASRAREVVAASFLNLDAVVEYVSKFSNIHLICAGTNGQITGEDVLLAGAISGRLVERNSVDVGNDSCRLATQYWRGLLDQQGGESLAKEFANSLGGRNLVAAGYQSDLVQCANMNVTTVVPRCISRDPFRFVVANHALGASVAVTSSDPFD